MRRPSSEPHASRRVSRSERQDIAAHGAPFVVVEPAHELGKEHCNFIIYKDRSKVPAKYYERLGLKKPDPMK